MGIICWVIIAARVQLDMREIIEEVDFCCRKVELACKDMGTLVRMCCMGKIRVKGIVVLC